MNKIITILLVSLFSILITFAQDPLIERIPSSSLFVTALKTTNLVSKLDLDAIKSLDLFQDLEKETKKSAKQDSSIIEQLFVDPSVYGLYFQPTSYIYLDYENKENLKPSVGALIPLKTGKKLEKMIISIMGKDVFIEKFEKKKGYTWMENSEFAFIYTKTYLLLYKFEGQNSELTLDEKVESLVNGNIESITSNKDFMTFQSKQTDLYYWMSFGSLFENTFNSVSDENKRIIKYFEHLKNAQFGYRINFNEGTINYQSEAFMSDKFTQNISKVYGEGIPQSMLNLITNEGLYALFGMSFDMEETEKLSQDALKEFKELIEETVSKEVVKQEIENGPIYIDKHDAIENDTTLSYFDKFEKYDKLDAEKDSLIENEKANGMEKLDSTMAEYGVQRTDLWSILNGNILAAINGTMEVVDTFETYDYTENDDGDFGYYQVEKTRNIEIPLFKVILDTKSPAKIQMVLDSTTSKGLLTKEEGYYSFSLTQYNYYVTLTETNIILSNDKKFITSFANGYETKDQITGTHADLLKNKPMYFYLDLQKTIKTSKKSLEDNKQATMVLEELEKIFYDLNSTGDVKEKLSYGEININLVDKQSNSLYSILQMVNNLYVTFTKKR